MSTKVTAVVLAGGPMDESLQHVAPTVKNKAWIPLGGRLMVEHVLSALEGCRSRVVERILVAPRADVPDEILARIDGVAEPGDSLFMSMENGVSQMRHNDLPVLGIPCDMCMLEPASIEDFIDRCERRPADVWYSYVRRETSETRYPGLRHTWVKLREGTFCGGGLAMVTPQVVSRMRALIDELTLARKRPWKLAGILGPKIIFKWMFGLLSTADAEERVSLLMKARVVGIESPFPDVGFNVDAPEELAVAKQLVAARGGLQPVEAKG